MKQCAACTHRLGGALPFLVLALELGPPITDRCFEGFEIAAPIRIRRVALLTTKLVHQRIENQAGIPKALVIFVVFRVLRSGKIDDEGKITVAWLFHRKLEGG